MKRAVSISLGSTKRDKSVAIDLLGERVLIERIGTNGDMEKAAQLYHDLDGHVDAFGVGGTDLTLQVDDRVFTLYSVKPMVRYVKDTPVVDGSGLKNTLEAMLAPFIEEKIGNEVETKHALITSGVDRWGMSHSFFEAGYDCVVGDLMFALGLPIPIKSESDVKRLAAVILPIATRLPFEWFYPTGEKQEVRDPKWESHYAWASVIAGDCNFITRHMPDKLPGKVIATNTTTSQDVELFHDAGVKYLVTSTPVYDGRSFGTNMMEAAIIAATGKDEPLTQVELAELIVELDLKPQLRKLN